MVLVLISGAVTMRDLSFALCVSLPLPRSSFRPMRNNQKQRRCQNPVLLLWNIP